MLTMRLLLAFFIASIGFAAQGQTLKQVVDVPTRDGVSNRILFLSPENSKATVILMPGGHGGLQMQADGSTRWGGGNFLVRSRQLFADNSLAVIVADAPSDRQSFPFLQGFRQSDEHTADLKALIAWARAQARGPVWVVGTSMGTLSTGWAAIQLQGAEGPDGIVLTSSIVSLNQGRPLTAMALEKIRIPVLVVHHESDACLYCAVSGARDLFSRLTNSPRHEFLAITGGSAKGDPCEAFHYHGYWGIEAEVVAKIAAWITAPKI